MLGISEEQLTQFGMTFGIAAFMLFMLFIIGELAWKSKAGKTGTFILFFVLAFGMIGFVAKIIIEKLWGI
ncbi:MAG: DUF2788 domain-containing protein [Rugosibacter sp.]|jgi:hypothetical protein|nr:DUF2788 domain-containing protein [Rugosibacter sp.]MDO9273703.1 DUF2788 domain-containing protein [Rugosibacter sp.]